MIVLEALVLLYLVIGIVLWKIGIKHYFNGKQGYKEYLKSIKAPTSAYFYCVIIFVCSWPLFIKRKGDDNEN